MSWGDALKGAATGAGLGGVFGPGGWMIGAAAGTLVGGRSDIKQALDAANKAPDNKATSICTDCEPKGPDPDCDSEKPPPLQKFEKDINGYTAEELNSAAITVFGEMSPNLTCERIKDEARAIASTIFNRRSAILTARLACNAAMAAVTPLQKAFDSLKQQSTRVSKADWPELKKKYDGAAATLSAAQRAQTAACGDKMAAESYLSVADHDKAPSLTSIVSAKSSGGGSQYVGYAKGLGDFQSYPDKNPDNNQRNCKRWTIAKKAVAALATGQTPDPYVEFRANRGGERSLKAGETRICGNDFSKGNM